MIYNFNGLYSEWIILYEVLKLFTAAYSTCRGDPSETLYPSLSTKSWYVQKVNFSGKRFKNVSNLIKTTFLFYELPFNITKYNFVYTADHQLCIHLKLRTLYKSLKLQFLHISAFALNHRNNKFRFSFTEICVAKEKYSESWQLF